MIEKEPPKAPVVPRGALPDRGAQLLKARAPPHSRAAAAAGGAHPVVNIMHVRRPPCGQYHACEAPTLWSISCM